ncbi:MAG: response regulator [Candidatus Omnitrophica bacterium]|nr:response regulator [Candidatus Omnitrophota bacterium]
MVKLLVVDDEQEICDFLREFFEEKNFKVRTALSGEEALRYVAEEQPDVCLLDIKMPGEDGLEVLRKIKRKYPAVKVIMVTALEAAEKMEEAARMGADNYIIKPLSLEYLENDVYKKISGSS